VRASAPTETRFEKLQRQFVDGSISVEQYEQALDGMNPRDLP